MIPFLTACLIGVVLATRWQAATWVLGAMAIAAFPLFQDGSIEARATMLMASIAGYNLGLVAGLVLGGWRHVATASGERPIPARHGKAASTY